MCMPVATDVFGKFLNGVGKFKNKKTDGLQDLWIQWDGIGNRLRKLTSENYEASHENRATPKEFTWTH